MFRSLERVSFQGGFSQTRGLERTIDTLGEPRTNAIEISSGAEHGILGSRDVVFSFGCLGGVGAKEGLDGSAEVFRNDGVGIWSGVN